MFCYVIIYFIANGFGIYFQVLTNNSQENSYKNTIKFINGRMKLEKEKQQQEFLMVSVLPAHIAVEMKTEMIKKTRKAQIKSMINNNNDDFIDEAPKVFFVFFFTFYFRQINTITFLSIRKQLNKEQHPFYLQHHVK
jgi:hypothetical protein